MIGLHRSLHAAKDLALTLICTNAASSHDKVCAAGPLEQALGLLATLMLRNPAAAELAAESGCIESCVEVMQACEQDNFRDSATGTQWVLRQVPLPPVMQVFLSS